MSGDWADERARAWMLAHPHTAPTYQGSLAALLRDVESTEHACGDHVKARLDEQMVEVKRVVEEETVRLLHGIADRDQQYVASKLMQEILRRLEEL